MFKRGDKVNVNKDIYRWVSINGAPHEEVLYSKEGETGEVIEVFYSQNSDDTPIPHAKVLIEDKIKTFRLTSIERIREK